MAAQCRDATSVEYLVRQQQQLMQSELKPLDSYGLEKAVYTVSEVASIMRTSRSSIYEWVRRGIVCIRIGRQVRIPRNSVIEMLNGNITMGDNEVPVMQRAIPVERRQRRPLKSAEIPKPTQRQKATAKAEEKRALTLSEAASILRLPVSQMRVLLDERKIYFYRVGSKRMIPKNAIAHFANGLPPSTTVEENIAHFQASGDWDDDMQSAADRLRAEWSSEGSVQNSEKRLGSEASRGKES
jgi:excisionase family DNA binding protein